MTMQQDSEFDYIIVGAGSAGSVVANRLGAKGYRVLVVEAGGSDLSPSILVPAGMLTMPPKNFWHYDIEPDPTRKNRRDAWAAAKIVGGGSSVNAMLWVRGNPADYDGWAAQGADGWDYESLLPHMRSIEKYEGGGSHWRGGSGPQRVSSIRMKHPMAAHFLAGAAEAGIPNIDDYNGQTQLGSGWAQLSQRRGMRHGTGRSFLAPARRRFQVTLIQNARVHRVLLQEKRAIGIEYEVAGKIQRARASREVILSAGALESPAILLRSGVGDAKSLGKLGIEVVSDVPGVGKNLQEHPAISMTFDVTERTLNQELSAWGVVKHGLNFLLRGRGPATTGPTHATAFERLEEGAGAPTYQLMMVPLALAADRPTVDNPDNIHDKQNVKLSDTSRVTIFIARLHPSGRGSVTLRSADPHGKSIIEFPFFDNPSDIRVLTAGARRVRDIFATEAMKPYVVGESALTREIETDEQWENYIRETGYGGSHWVGTAKMGRLDDPLAVVDARLRVRGIQGLRVVDASVMPTITSGNTNAPSIIIGEKGAHLIAEDGPI